MNRKKLLLMIWLIVFSSTFQFGQAHALANEDGNWWITAKVADRLFFIRGFIVGVSLMNEQAIQSLKREDLPKGEAGAVAAWMIKSARSEAERLTLYGVANGQVLDGVNAFYNDFSVRKIQVVDAIYVVKMQINGADQDLIAAQIRYLKQQPINAAEEQQKAFEKIKPFDFDFDKCYAAGKITAEELFRVGFFVNKDNKLLPLFCYGNY